MEIRRIGVVGLGQMGGGIAQVCAQAGYATVVREVSLELLARGQERIANQLTRDVTKGKISAEARTATLDRMRGTTDLAAFADCDLVIEAIVERADAKRELWAALDQICPPETIFASNTSSIPIIEMAAATTRPDRVVGMHFFNPVPVMTLIEAVRSIATSDTTFQTIKAVGATLGKTVVEAQDTAGFIVNRLLLPYLYDAVRLLESGAASRNDIDDAMRLGCAHPMGPLTLLDFVGLDTAYNIGLIMYDELHDPRYAPPPLLKRMVQAGYFGRKSGKGFYSYV